MVAEPLIFKFKNTLKLIKVDNLDIFAFLTIWKIKNN